MGAALFAANYSKSFVLKKMYLAWCLLRRGESRLENLMLDVDEAALGRLTLDDGVHLEHDLHDGVELIIGEVGDLEGLLPVQQAVELLELGGDLEVRLGQLHALLELGGPVSAEAGLGGLQRGEFEQGARFRGACGGRAVVHLAAKDVASPLHPQGRGGALGELADSALGVSVAAGHHGRLPVPPGRRVAHIEKNLEKLN